MLEISVDKDLVLNAAQNVSKAAKNPKNSFSHAGILQITSKGDTIEFAASNGFLKAVRQVRDADKVQIKGEGSCFVDANLFVKILSALPTESGVLLKITADDSKLMFNTKAGKRSAKNWIPLIGSLPLEITPFKVKSDELLKIPSDAFSKCVKAVSSYCGEDPNDTVYHQILIDFHKEKISFVCGDGALFAIAVNKNNLNVDRIKDNEQYVLPAFQAALLQELFAEQGSSHILMAVNSDKYEFRTDFGLTVYVEGILDIKYVPYTQQSERVANRLGRCVVSGEDMRKMTKLMKALADKEYEKMNNIIGLELMMNKEIIEFKSEFTRGMDCTIPVEVFEYQKGESFSDRYSMNIISNVVSISDADSYEFSFFEPGDATFCELKTSNEEYEYRSFFSSLSQGK